ncbi:polysaccharide deacetylase family protein [Aliarcobacter cryaerophilus]|uniref:polysaccharide deacetylase family protein n=1 Tax=Aliarcobacter cryaerophilus TaxID=28198 RepID=UPI003AF3D536
MIKITIPNNNIAERKYILDIIFDEFLGLDFKVLESDDCQDWEMELENGSKIIFEDHFFNKYLKGLEYLKLENIPCTINYEHKESNQFIVENNIPVIYGNSKLETKDQKLKTIICGIDIFASCFFMLTRWEEYVNKNRDKHDRFPATESLAFKQSFLDRPVVNEYVEMLKNMMKKLDNTLVFKEKEFGFLLTHDVDSVAKYNNIKSCILELGADILKRKSIILAMKSLMRQVKVKILKIKKDPFDTFDYLMDVSEKLNTKSYFFFMGKGETKYDNHYKSSSKTVLKIVENIKSRGHEIGIHPSYNAYNDFEQLKKEKEELEQNLNTTITFGREHYLRFEVPTTWQIWEDNGMEWDSTCSYADKEGFRCGVCYEYSVFNILTRKKLKLKEKPLIVMETSLFTYQNLNDEKIISGVRKLLEKVIKYNGNFVFLWHNSSFKSVNLESEQTLYEKMIKGRVN